MSSRTVVAVLVGFACSGCGGALSGTPTSEPGEEAARRAVAFDPREFDAALREFAAADDTSWTARRCKSLARRFVALGESYERAKKRPLAAAHYNAGLVHARCGDDVAAARQFALTRKKSGLPQARTQLVLHEYRRSENVGRAIEELDTIVRDARYQDVEALVRLAALQMEHAERSGGEADFDAAKRNLQRALAIQNGYLPAINQMALYHLSHARGASRGLELAGSARDRASTQQLELAELVASQGLRRNDRYAPLHNTLGLVRAELGDFTGASRHFRRAAKLDPDLFEAHMNFAAINTSFRGFVAAERAYRRALAVRPNDYEALLGLALALRGQVVEPTPDARLEEAKRVLAKAKQLMPGRPEASFNEALLVEHFDARTGDERAERELERAATLLEEFLAKAGDDERYTNAVARATERLEDIRQTLDFLRKGTSSDVADR